MGFTVIVTAHVPELSIEAMETLGTNIDGTMMHDRSTGQLDLTFGASDSTMRQVCDFALRLVRDSLKAAGVTATVTGIRVVENEAYRREVEAPAEMDLVGTSEIAAMLGVSRQRASQLANTNPDFPPAIGRVSGAPVFTRRSVEAFAEHWERRRTGRPRKAS